jgi:hypothetical protein
MRRLVIAVTLLVAAAFAADTLLTQDFDAFWRTNNPPLGWRIFHTGGGPMGRGDWDRTSNVAPWASHPTPYAGIRPDPLMDGTPDSLISPTIDCSAYWQVTLRCSTNFADTGANPYQAQIKYSIDGGLTFPYVARDYYDDSTGTICESLVLDQAMGQAAVQILWVFYGDLWNIQNWYVDDVVVTAETLLQAPLFYEDFNSAWNTNNPPFGWRIFHTSPPVGRDDWHREDAHTPPWNLHPSPFAAIGPTLSPDAPPDSLISPVIDCSGFRNIMLVCSTYFYRWSEQPYTARIVYSTDGGATWPYTLHDYYVSSDPSPVVESLRMDAAEDQANVQLAWVYDGNINYIQWWSLDDVLLIGETIPTWDIACESIVYPTAEVPPVPTQPTAIFHNYGSNAQFGVAVACSLYDNTMTGLTAWTDVIGTLLPDSEATVTFTPPYTLSAGQYFIKVWSEADSDYVRGNDTLALAFEASMLREVSYDDSTPDLYETWPVGHCGWGVKLDADTFPVYIESLKVYLDAPADPNHCGYQLAVFLDDGTGQPGKLYSKTPVQYATAGTSGWNSVFMADVGEQLVIPDGQFYVFYLQVGEPPECPALARDAARNPLASYWQYRKGVMLPDSTPGDFMIRAVVYLDGTTPVPGDLRALYVDQPLYDFVQRPFDAPITPKGRVENFGSTTVAPVNVQCDIFGPGPTLYYTNTQTLSSLAPGEDTLVTFADWVPTTAERCSVVLTTMAGGDPVPQNDEKRFAVDVLKGAHTGLTPLRYGWIDSDTIGGPTYAWIDTNGFNTLGDLGDNGYMNIPFEPGMKFRFYDSLYDFVVVSANGWVALGRSIDPAWSLDTVPDRLPTPTAPNRCIYAWWDNLAMGANHGHGLVYYRWFGIEPSRYLVVVFQDVNRVGSDTADGITFELIFRENGTITCQYKDVETGDLNFDNGKNASIGLENIDGVDGLNYLYARPPMSTAVNDLANRLSPGRAILFYPETRDAAALKIIRPGLYDYPGTITPRALIQNYGTVSDSIRVFMTIGGIYSDDTLIPALPAGESAYVDFDPWIADLGNYTAICSVHMYDDINPSNNVVSNLVRITSWARRADIPPQWRKRKVKYGALCYAPSTHKLYAMKGSNTLDFWQYDIATDTWDTLRPMPAEPSGRRQRHGAHLTFDPNYGALGRIWAIKGGNRSDFYFYDIAADTWYERKSMIVIYKDWPYSARPVRSPRRGAAIEYVQEVGDSGSVYGIPGNRTNHFWRYDIALDSWTYPHDSVMVQYGGYQYWRWEPLDVPYGDLGRRCKYGSDLTYTNGKLYLIKGSNTGESYAFTPSVNGWTDTLDQNSLIRDTRRKVKMGGSIVAFGSRLYVLKGGNTQEFFSWHPADRLWHRCTDIPLALEGRRRKVKRGSAMAATDSAIFCLKGSGTYELWEYRPGADSIPPLLGSQPEREGVMAEQSKLDLSQPWLVAYPNPTRVGLNISYNITSTAPTRLRVYDAAGKVVTDLWNATRSRGQYVTHWSGLAANGRQVPAGIYFVKLESGDSRLTQKFVVQH